MLISLTVKDSTPDEGYRKILNSFKKNSPKAFFAKSGDLSVLHIIYEQKTGKTDWRAINKMVRNSKYILCDKKLSIPPFLPLIRFQSHALCRRLAENAVLELLCEAKIEPAGIKIGLIDPLADSLDMPALLVPYTTELHVLTDCIDEYSDECERIMYELGAAVLPGYDPDRLSTCDIIISPGQLPAHLKTKQTAIIFTGERPKHSISRTVFFDYTLNLPPEYEKIRPYDLSPEYFATALYMLCGQHELGAAVPGALIGDGFSYPTESFAKYLSNMFT